MHIKETFNKQQKCALQKRFLCLLVKQKIFTTAAIITIVIHFIVKIETIVILFINIFNVKHIQQY